MRLSTCLAASLFALSLSPASAAEVIRHTSPESASPIARAVEVPAGWSTVYVSGVTPGIGDASAPKDSAAAYGDTEAQTLRVLERIRERLKALGLDMRDVVKMQVFLVADPALDGRADMDGFRRAYARYFGKEAGQPALPARSTFQIAALGNPHYRVEIEVIAAKAPKR